MPRRLVLALLAAFAFLAAPGVARACSCYCAPDPWPMVEGTAVIFNGRVMATRIVGAFRHYDVAVTAVRKGAVDEKLTVSTPNSSAACGMTGLAVGDELLFLAHPAGERAGLGINSCGMGCAQRHRAVIEAGLKVCPPGGPCTGER